MIELPALPYYQRASKWYRKALLWFLFDAPSGGRTIFDINCGWHSGMRPCCILWFVTANRWISGTAIRRGYHRLIDWQSERLTRQGKLCFDHVPCPICLAKGRAVVLRDCECSTWLGRLAGEPLTTPSSPP